MCSLRSRSGYALSAKPVREEVGADVHWRPTSMVPFNLDHDICQIVVCLIVIV